MQITVPFSRSYWIVPGKFMAGCYPGSEDEKEADRGLSGLLEHGIRHIINLMEPQEVNRSGKQFVSYEAKMRSIADEMGISVTFDRIPIKDTWIPSRVDMGRILDRIDGCMANDEPIFLHCWGGRGRTGTVVGCYLARHGIASDRKNLELIKKLRENTEDGYLPSPETPPQNDMVLSWVEGE